MAITKVDANQADIVAALQRVGAVVESLASVGHGVPDLLCGFAGALLLMEVKSRPAGRLTPLQVGWHRRWEGYPVYIVHNEAEALHALGVETVEMSNA